MTDNEKKELFFKKLHKMRGEVPITISNGTMARRHIPEGTLRQMMHKPYSREMVGCVGDKEAMQQAYDTQSARMEAEEARAWRRHEQANRQGDLGDHRGKKARDDSEGNC